MASDQELVQQFTAQERELLFPRFDDEIAFRLGVLIRDNFLARYDRKVAGVAISINLHSGHTLFSCAVGSSLAVGPDNWGWIQRKCNTVRRFGKSSFLVGRSLVVKGKSIDSLGSDFAAHGGAFPINIAGVSSGPIGAIAVSGLPQAEDHALVVDSLRQLLADLK